MIKRNQPGFTLIEIAIVLVIIGLLLGGVLKVQALINSAKVKSLAGDFNNIPVFIYGYQDKYKAVPGDDANAAIHVTGGTVCSPAAANNCTTNNGIIEGNWNATSISSESFVFWQHVRLAGFAPGSTDTTSVNYLPKNAAGGSIGITNAANTAIAGLTGTYIICSDGIAGKFAKQLDITLDDGNTATGILMVTTAGTSSGGAAILTANIVDDTPYLVCMGV